MLKLRPHVLLSLLALAGITVFSSVQYGIWNVRAGNVNRGILGVLNPEEHKEDVTNKPEYGKVLDAVQQHFPNATVRIVDSSVNEGAFQGSKRVLSVAVLAPELDGQVQLGQARIAISSRYAASRRLFMRQVDQVHKELRPILNQMDFPAFDVQTLCITSHFKVLPTVWVEGSQGPGDHPLSINHLMTEVWMEKNASTSKFDVAIMPHVQKQWPLGDVGFNQPAPELPACTYVTRFSHDTGTSIVKESWIF